MYEHPRWYLIKLATKLIPSEHLVFAGHGWYPFKEVHHYRDMPSAAWPADIYSRIQKSLLLAGPI